MFSICSKHNDSVESVENCFCFVSFRINYSAYDALRQVLFGFLSCASRSIIIIMSFYFSPQFHFEQKRKKQQRITHSLNSEHMKLWAEWNYLIFITARIRSHCTWAVDNYDGNFCEKENICGTRTERTSTDNIWFADDERKKKTGNCIKNERNTCYSPVARSEVDISRQPTDQSNANGYLYVCLCRLVRVRRPHIFME